MIVSTALYVPLPPGFVPVASYSPAMLFELDGDGVESFAVLLFAVDGESLLLQAKPAENKTTATIRRVMSEFVYFTDRSPLTEFVNA